MKYITMRTFIILILLSIFGAFIIAVGHNNAMAVSNNLPIPDSFAGVAEADNKTNLDIGPPASSYTFFDTDTNTNTDTDSAHIMALLKERDKQIKKMLGEKGTEYTPEQRQEIKDIINGIIEYRAMASYALGSTWDTLSTERKDQFVEVFSKVVRDQSMNKLDIYRAEITYNDIDVVGDSAYVKTSAILDNVKTPVSYTMEKRGENWVVTDFTVDDVSTAKSYRRSFQNIIRRKGYQALYNSLKKRSER